MKQVELASGRRLPALGQGTWNMGEDAAMRQREIESLQLGFDLGLTVVDTAEMYADGGAEEVVGAAIAGRREQVFVVSKFYPHHADLRGMRAACERSLKRLGSDRIDLYLLHWRGAVPLAETLDGLVRLQREGKIVEYGVSNFDLDDMRETAGLAGGARVALNQVLYNLAQRGPEWDLLPWCRAHGIPLMAYSPLESGGAERARLLATPELQQVARRHGATPAQVALAWLLRDDGVMAIPKAADAGHVRANRAALDMVLTKDDLAELDRGFPAPQRRRPLAMR
ncbi:MAG: aldo/keto reductase [Pseudomonadota bacterium]